MRQIVEPLAELSAPDWHRLNRLLDQAVDLDAEARALWLAGLPAGDSHLLPVLRQLLSRCEDAETDDFLPSPADLVAQARGAGDTDPLPADRPGDEIGPYRILRELGRGGMGVVWLARRSDGVIERQVALKIPGAEWTDRGLAGRMARERAVLSSLNHPNIAQLYDAGWSARGRPFLALEHVDGRPIDAWCRDNGLDVDARVRLFIEVIRAVGYAHTRLVVHRDLKPANVLVTAEGRVKLLDFGIAKLLEAEAASVDATELTRRSGGPLTLAYAAPEQVLGQPISTSTDVYALGVMLYELLCGHRPYPAAANDRRALEQAIVTTDPPPPSARVAGLSRPRAWRADLDAIVLKALRKEPDKRYETAPSFADDLQRYLDGRPVRAQRDSTWYRARRFVARNRVGIIASAAVTLALVAGVATTQWEAHRAREQANRAEVMSRFVLSMIQQADPQASQRTRDADITLLSTAEQRIDRELKGRPDLALAVRIAIATAYRNRGDTQRAARLLRTAIDEAAPLVAEDDLDLLGARVLLAECRTAESFDERTELDRAVVTLRRLGPKGAALLVDALVARFDLFKFQGDLVRWQQDAREALDVARGAFGPGDEHTLAAATRLAEIVGPMGQHRYAQAFEVLEPVLKEAEARARLDSGSPVLLRARATYGLMLCVRDVGRTQPAIELLESTLNSAIEHHGLGSHVASKAFVAMSRGYLYVGQYPTAVRTALSHFAVMAARQAMGAPDRVEAAYEAYIVLQTSGRIDEASALFEEARLQPLLMNPGPLRENALAGLDLRRAWLLTNLGEPSLALPIFDAALAEMERGSAYIASIWVANKALAMERLGDAVGGERLVTPVEARLREAATTSADYVAAIQAQVMLSAGRAPDALAISDRLIAGGRTLGLDIPDPGVVKGRALLALNRPAEAAGALERADRFWREYDPTAIQAREARYWYGIALEASVGEEAARRLLGAISHTPPAREQAPRDLVSSLNRRQSAMPTAEEAGPTEARIAGVLARAVLRPDVSSVLAKGIRTDVVPARESELPSTGTRSAN